MPLNNTDYSFDPSAFNIPSGYGSGGGGGGSGDIWSAIGGLGIGSLFGGDSGWKPYVDANGNYVFTNPGQKNPVPVAGVPGATLRPSKTYRQTANQIQAMQDLYPFLMSTINSQILPNQQAQLASAQATSGPYAQLMLDLFRQYGPQLNQVGNEINLQNMMANASNQNAVAQGPGKDLVNSLLQLQMIQDPEYFKTRALTSSRIGDLMNSIDLSGGLSGTENREIAQGLAQQGNQRGNANAPSNLDTIAGAMRYGNAGRTRVLQNQSALSNAIQSATQFLPASRTGTDVFQVATGSPSMPNQGASNFTGVNQGASNTFGTLAGLGSNFQNNTNALNQTNAQIQAQKKDWLDQFVQFSQGMKNSTSSLGSMFGGMMG